ncbi:MAG: PAS domain S-box protein [Chitinophagales bacterium]
MLNTPKGKYKLIVIGGAVFGLLVGLCVLTGWITNYHPLKVLLPGYPSMKFTTSLCFILSGLSLLLHLSDRPLPYLFRSSFSFTVLGVALLSLLRILFGLDLGLDHIFKDTDCTAGGEVLPGCMALGTALSFVLLAEAFLFMKSGFKWLKILSQYSLHFISLLSVLALLGYLYEVPILYKLTAHGTMAPHTAVVFFILSVTASFVNPAYGITGLFTGRSLGNLMAQRVLPLSLAAILSLGILRLVTFKLNLVNNELAIIINVMAFMVVILIIIAIVAKQLNEIDAKKLAAQQELAKVNSRLEQIVEERTAELRHTGKKLEATTSAANIGLWSADFNTKTVAGDASFYRILGLPAGTVSLSFEEVKSLMVAEDLVKVLKKRTEIDGGNNEFDIEVRFKHPGGNIRYVHAKGKVERGNEGAPTYMLSALWDITAEKEANEKLQRSEERFQKMISEVEDYAIILLDADGNIVNWNKGAEQIKGYTEKEAIGQNFRIFYTREDQERKLPEALLAEAVRTGRNKHEGWRVRKDGSVFWAAVSIVALTDADHNITGFTKITRDLTLREAEAAARKHVLDLEARNRELEQFAYIASHDLQEPLRSIANYVHLLMDEYGSSLDQNAVSYLDNVSAASTKLSTLIKALLDYSRLGRNREYGPVDCQKLLSDVITELKPEIQQSGAQVIVRDMPELLGHEAELYILFKNLVENALRFKKDKVLPSILVSASKEPGKWKFAVKDNGIGIDPKYFERIFYIFQRLHHRNKYAGDGIGLAYCKKIIELHGGEIWIDSKPGEGSTFYFTIPNRNA